MIDIPTYVRRIVCPSPMQLERCWKVREFRTPSAGPGQPRAMRECAPIDDERLRRAEAGAASGAPVVELLRAVVPA